jgi:hypothetical protein
VRRGAQLPRIFVLAGVVAGAVLLSSCANVLPITVYPLTPDYPIVNVATVSVTICAPGSTSNCQTVDHMLLDTGSSGLRVLASQVSGLGLTPISVGGASLAECVSFGIGTTWGPVAMASVVLGKEPSVLVPIQVIDTGFGQQPPPSPCNAGANDTTQRLGANGLIGVAPLQFDTGFGGGTDYFTCTQAACMTATPAAAQVVQNAVFLLPVDNNGIYINLNAVPGTGAGRASGELILGIGTQVDNAPSAVVQAPYVVSSGLTDGFIEHFTSKYKSRQFQASLLDSGTNGFFFFDSGIDQCQPFIFTTVYCPTITVGLTGEMGSGPIGQNMFAFGVSSENVLQTSGNSALPTLAFVAPSFSVDEGDFTWGLPFFYGRSVAIPYQKTDAFGDVPAWAFAPLSIPQSELVECSVFNDGYHEASSFSKAVTFENALPFPFDQLACIPGGPGGICQKWFGLCRGVDSRANVSFSVFDDPSATAGPSDAIYMDLLSMPCIPDGTPTGNCKHFFGHGTSSTRRQVTCSLFDDGDSNQTSGTDQISAGAGRSVCTASECHKWFGRCVAQ